MQFIVYLLILIFVPISVYANSDAPDFEVTIEKGKIFFNNSEYAKALEEFNSAVSAKPDDPAANWWLGVSYLKAGNHEKAIAPLTKATRDPELSVTANYYLGTAYYRLGFFEDAKKSFESVLAHSPTEDLKSYAHGYLDYINKRMSAEQRDISAKPLELTFAAGIQYDTNAILAPDDEKLVSVMGIKKGSNDWRSVLYLDGVYNLINSKNWRAGAGYSVYQNLHKRHSSYNANVQSLSAFSVYSKDPFSVKAEYDYEYTFFGGHRFSSIHSLSSVLSVIECPHTSSELTYAYHKNYYWDSHLATTNSHRRGHNNSIGISQIVRISNAIHLTAGYNYDVESAIRDYWSYNGDKFSVSIDAVKNPWRFDLGAETYNRKYKEQDPVAAMIRADRTHTYSAGITRALSQRVDVILMYDFVNSNSNMESFAYKREISSIFATIRF